MALIEVMSKDTYIGSPPSTAFVRVICAFRLHFALLLYDRPQSMARSGSNCEDEMVRIMAAKAVSHSQNLLDEYALLLKD